MKDEIWYDELTFEAVGAAYGTAQAATGAPTRGDLGNFSIERDGAGNGTVTVQVAEDSSFTRLLLEVDVEDLNGDGAVDVWGDTYRPAFRSTAGPYFRVKDTADNADTIKLNPRGVSGHGA